MRSNWHRANGVVSFNAPQFRKLSVLKAAQVPSAEMSARSWQRDAMNVWIGLLETPSRDLNFGQFEICNCCSRGHSRLDKLSRCIQPVEGVVRLDRERHVVVAGLGHMLWQSCCVTSMSIGVVRDIDAVMTR